MNMVKSGGQSRSSKIFGLSPFGFLCLRTLLIKQLSQPKASVLPQYGRDNSLPTAIFSLFGGLLPSFRGPPSLQTFASLQQSTPGEKLSCNFYPLNWPPICFECTMIGLRVVRSTYRHNERATTAPRPPTPQPPRNPFAISVLRCLS